jgi:protein O-mannosyl-transferase
MALALNRQNRRFQTLWVCLALVGLTLVVFGPVARHQFLNYDDDKYVTANAQVTHGLSWQNVGWAFQTGAANFWHPLTWLSHMLDCQLYGLRPGGHHLTSLGLHLLNTLLLFGLCRRLTGAGWRSALVAALFAVHPLHVESVAWVAERKDVLSTFFGLLSLLAYGEYVRSAPRNTQHATRSTLWYLLALLLFACSLMSKPMLVTLPFVLLLLDYWPLGRLRLGAPGAARSTLLALRPLLLEKVPFLVLAVLFSVLAVWAQQHGGSLMPLEALPLDSRVANALVSYARYLGKTVWPASLAVPYPLVTAWAWWQVAGAGALLLAATVGALSCARRAPWVLTGWFWFCGTLVPVIGLVQVGNYSLADRFTYLPSVGLFLLVAWTLHQAVVRWPQCRGAVVGASLLLVGVAGWGAASQVHYWQDSATLFEHAVQVTQNNYIAYNNLGTALAQAGQSERAQSCFVEALRLRPEHPEAHINLALALTRQHQYAEAVTHYEAALRVAPADAQAHINLANLLDQLGHGPEALLHYQAALRSQPQSPEAEYNLAASLAGQGRLEEAVAHYEAALRLAPQNASAHYNLATLLGRLGRRSEAKAHYLAALRLNPAHAAAHNNLGNLLVRLGEGQEAAAHFTAALALEPNFAQAHFSLARLLVGQGQFEAAQPHLRAARGLRPDWASALDELEQAGVAGSITNRSRSAAPELTPGR